MIVLVFVALSAFGVLIDNPILTVFAGMAACIATFVWLVRRHPLIAIMLVGFLRGLLGGR